jgi:ATP-dependent Clp protease ATP-binding subunit ClpA
MPIPIAGKAGLIAHKNGVDYIGTEHLLLGVLSRGSSMGAKILASRGITYERVQGALDLTPQALTVIVTFNGVNKDIATSEGSYGVINEDKDSYFVSKYQMIANKKLISPIEYMSLTEVFGEIA